MYTACVKYGLVDSVMQWLQTGIVDSKAKWKNTVNQAIGYYEYCTWRAECMMYKRMDTFKCVVPEPSLCIWWLIALWDFRTAGNCRFMFRLMCRENVLECNVGRYKGIPRGEQICPLCNLTKRMRLIFCGAVRHLTLIDKGYCE